MKKLTVAALAAATVASCGDPAGAPQVEVAVQALTLVGVTDAVYDLSVYNDVGDLVWQERVTSSQYGDGQGSLTYVGPCDASDNDNDGSSINTVALKLLDLPPLKADEWVNPTATGPLVQAVACEENRDQHVEFNLAILRAAEQGFFDVAVNFDDIFCSAKLDCANDDGTPIDLLENPQTGARESTVVLAVGCTAGLDADTQLTLEPVSITCGSGEAYTVDPSQVGLGGPVPPLLFATLVTRGGEELAGASKRYWNVALGVDDAVLGGPNGGHTDCRVRTRATASDGPLPSAQSPGTVWPYIVFDVPLNQGAGMTCSQHGLGDGNGVSVVYQ